MVDILLFWDSNPAQYFIARAQRKPGLKKELIFDS
mgnify:CR=1 FL=1|jgi:hypothetical protein